MPGLHLGVAGVATEPGFERVATIIRGLTHLFNKNFVEKIVEYKTPEQFGEFQKRVNASKFAANLTTPWVWVGEDQAQPVGLEGLLQAVRPFIAETTIVKQAKPLYVQTSGYVTCPWYMRTSNVVTALTALLPGKVFGTPFHHQTRDAYRAALPKLRETLAANSLDAEAVTKHQSSPITWIGEKESEWEYLGGHDSLMEMLRDLFSAILPPPPPKLPFVWAQNADPLTEEDGKSYDFDVFVIGGGSGGLACSKEVARYGKRVAVCDFVWPSTQNTTWGLGGTCVNVGCIPKKLMHQAALLGEAASDSTFFGWESATAPTSAPPTTTTAGAAAADVKSGEQKQEHKATPPAPLRHNWHSLVKHVQEHIHKLNAGYETQLKSKQVTYYNALGSFVDPHTIELVDAQGKRQTRTARRIVIAVGGRPQLPAIPGAREYCITSDDLFSLAYPPGKDVLVIGASYVALECAGFLAGIGCNVTVMVRSILLRGFDTEIADKIGDFMEAHGIKFIWEQIPVRVDKLDEKKEAKGHGRLRVSYIPANKEKSYMADAKSVDPTIGEFDTVLIATGRQVNTSKLNLAAAGVKLDPATGKIPVVFEQTNVPHIYGIGDCIVAYKPLLSSSSSSAAGAGESKEGKFVSAASSPATLELTPVAIQSGRLLARRLFGKSQIQMDYTNVPTTVFTPLEYGACGLSEEAAFEQFGKANIDVYHAQFQPLETTLSNRLSECYCKLIVNKADKNRVVGFHILAPSAGEITQGVAVAIKCGATKDDFDSTIGIHPTVAEWFTLLDVTKGSGASAAKSGC